MSGNYRVILRYDQSMSKSPACLYEQGCPLCTDVIQLSQNIVTSQIYMQMRIRNVSARPISDFVAIATVQYKNGTSETIEVREESGAVIAPEATKDLPIQKLSRKDVDTCRLDFKEVYCGNTKWASSSSPVIPNRIPLDKEIASSKERTARIGRLNGRPKKYKILEQEQYWICSCGQVNLAEREQCCACSGSKATFKALESKERLNSLAQERKKKTRRLIRIPAAAAAACVVLFVIVTAVSSFTPEQTKAIAQTQFTAIASKDAYSAIHYDNPDDNGYKEICNIRCTKDGEEIFVAYSYSEYTSSTSINGTRFNAYYPYEIAQAKLDADGNLRRIVLNLGDPTLTEESDPVEKLGNNDRLTFYFADGKITDVEGRLPSVGLESI